MPRTTTGARRALALAALTMLATGVAGVLAPVAGATVHHPLCSVTSEQVGPPTSDDPCVPSEVTELEEGGDPAGQPWPGPCHEGFRMEVLYNPAGFAYGVCVPL